MNDKEFERFMNNVDKTKSCWNWTGCLDIGYGKFSKINGTSLAHRILFEHVNGKVELDLHHKCENKRCVNPSHLKAVTSKEHSILNMTKYCKNGHLRENNTVKNVQCLICQNEWSKRRAKSIKDDTYIKPLKSTETHCRNGHLWKTYGKIEPRGNRLCKKCANIRNKQRRERMNNKDVKK